MKILYVDLQYDYGIKSRGFNEIGKLGFEKGFRDLGHDLECFYYDHYLNNDLAALQTDLIIKAESVKPDIIFFVLFQDQFKFETLDKLKEKYVTINWFGDDTWRFESFTARYAPHFTLSVTTDKWSISKYEKLGPGVKVALSQWASLEFPIEDTAAAYEFDVSFVGGHHPVRTWFVKELGRKGVDVQCFGHGWSNGTVSNARMREIFRRSRINLNLSNSTTFDVRYLISSPKSFYRGVTSPKNASQIKARNFEIPYCGGFQMTDYVPGIEDFFEIGKELSCYRDINDAVLLIDHFLANDREREMMRNRCIERVRMNHTYKNRMADLLKALGI